MTILLQTRKLSKISQTAKIECLIKKQEDSEYTSQVIDAILHKIKWSSKGSTLGQSIFEWDLWKSKEKKLK